jgi:hypothetical protein
LRAKASDWQPPQHGGHYDVSVACADDKMLPVIRHRDPETLVLADGFSCRTHICEFAAECDPRHIAQVLAEREW